MSLSKINKTLETSCTIWTKKKTIVWIKANLETKLEFIGHIWLFFCIGTCYLTSIDTHEWYISLTSIDITEIVQQINHHINLLGKYPNGSYYHRNNLVFYDQLEHQPTNQRSSCIFQKRTHVRTTIESIQKYLASCTLPRLKLRSLQSLKLQNFKT